MNRPYTYTPMCSPLLLLFFVCSCSGQVGKTPSAIRQSKHTTDRIQPKMLRTQGVQSGNVGCVLQDKDGNLWFGTGGEGVYRFNGKTFINFTTKDGLSSNYVNAIIQDRKGNILFGTGRGLSKYDGKLFGSYPGMDSISKMTIACLLEDRKGKLWFGTIEAGVYCYDPLVPSSNALTNYLNNDDQVFNLGAHHQSIMDILEDRSGNIWFSSWNGGGVWKYDPLAAHTAGSRAFTNFLPSVDYYKSNEDNRSFTNVKVTPAIALSNYLPVSAGRQPQTTITDDMIFSMAEDRAGNLWFATRGHGACRYDGKTFTSFREREGFVSRGVYSILEDKKGNIWLTTEDNGVWCYNPSPPPGAGSKAFKNFTTKNGLICNSVFSVFEDKDGNLWFGTRQFGLSRYDPSLSGSKAFADFSERPVE